MTFAREGVAHRRSPDVAPATAAVSIAQMTGSGPTKRRSCTTTGDDGDSPERSAGEVAKTVSGSTERGASSSSVTRGMGGVAA